MNFLIFDKLNIFTICSRLYFFNMKFIFMHSEQGVALRIWFKQTNSSQNSKKLVFFVLFNSERLEIFDLVKKERNRASVFFLKSFPTNVIITNLVTGVRMFNIFYKFVWV